MRLVTHGLTVCCTLVAALGGASTAWAQLPVFTPGERTHPVYGAHSRDRVPHWLELPRTARIRTGEEMKMSPLQNSAISFENLKLGVLVGALRNDGGCISQVNSRLQYVDEHWHPMGPPIPNEARVSQVEPGGIMPYRFQLRTIAESKVPPSAYLVIVEQDDKPIANPYSWNGWVSTAARTAADQAPCTASSTRVEAAVTKRQPLRAGFLVEGMLILVEGGPVRPDGIVITALLRDEEDGVLEVLVGAPMFKKKDLPRGVLEQGQRIKFRLHTVMPLGKDVADVDVMVELLPDAVVADNVSSPQR